MGKTTVMIDDALLKKALEITGAKTKREVIVAGLEELIRNRNREALRRELGTFDLDLTLDELKKLRDET